MSPQVRALRSRATYTWEVRLLRCDDGRRRADTKISHKRGSKVHDVVIVAHDTAAGEETPTGSGGAQGLAVCLQVIAPCEATAVSAHDTAAGEGIPGERNEEFPIHPFIIVEEPIHECVALGRVSFFVRNHVGQDGFPIDAVFAQVVVVAGTQPRGHVILVHFGVELGAYCLSESKQLTGVFGNRK